MTIGELAEKIGVRQPYMSSILYGAAKEEKHKKKIISILNIQDNI